MFAFAAIGSQEVNPPISLAGPVMSPVHGDEFSRSRPRAQPLVPVVDFVLWVLSDTEQFAEGRTVVARLQHPRGRPHRRRVVEFLEALRKGLRRALRDPELAPVRAELLIEDFAILPLGAYQRMLEMEAEATRLGHHLPLKTNSV